MEQKITPAKALKFVWEIKSKSRVLAPTTGRRRKNSRQVLNILGLCYFFFFF